MKIIAVGMNYARHNKELGHTQINTEPVIFMKPDSAILKDSKPFFIPDFSNEIHYETELVVRINRLGKNIAPRFANRYYDAVTVGIDFTARDLQRKFREQGNPWELCKGFDSSAAIGTFVFSLLMLYLFPEISFINRMGYVFLLCALIIVIFGLVCPNTKLANTIELNAKLFRTTTLFKILSILILAILCVIYYIFW